MTYEGLLKKVHGKAYDRKLLAILFANSIPNGLIVTSIVMIMFSPPLQRCNLPSYVPDEIERNTTLRNAVIDFFLPRDTEDENMTSKCLKYNRTYEEFVEFWNNSMLSKNYVMNDNATTIPCVKDKQFYQTYNTTSSVMEFDWTCEQHWLKPLSISLFMAGICLGSLSGLLADRFGRKPVFCYFTFLMCGSIFFLGFVNSSSLFMILFAVSGIGSLVTSLTGFVLGAECTVPGRRNFLSLANFISYAICYPITSLLGYWLPGWRWMVKIIGLSGIVFIANLWLVPESPRWLMANGKVEEAKKVLAMIAKYNGKEHVIKELDEDVEEEASALIKEADLMTTEKTRMWYVFKQVCQIPRLLIYFIISSFSWLAVNMVYYGLSLSVQSLSGNLYVNNTLMGLIEFPGIFLAYMCVKYFSRPVCHGGLLIISGIFCLIAAFLNNVSPIAATIGGLVGKSFNSGAFYFAYIHTAEIFPTVTRNSLLGLGSTSGRVGAIITPYLAHLGELYGMYVPFLILSIIGIIAGCSVFFGLPETKDQALPETADETLQFELLVIKYCRHKTKRRTSEDIKYCQPRHDDDDGEIHL